MAWLKEERIQEITGGDPEKRRMFLKGIRKALGYDKMDAEGNPVCPLCGGKTHEETTIVEVPNARLDHYRRPSLPMRRLGRVRFCGTCEFAEEVKKG